MTIPKALVVARRAIDGFPELSLVRDLAWSYEVKKWTLCVDIQIDDPSEHVPAVTRWWFHLSPRYPWGNVEIYPDNEKGIVATFPHQDLNRGGGKRDLWRTGDICVREPVTNGGQREESHDPLGSGERLAWYLDRTISWLKNASGGTLNVAGEPFELPQFAGTDGTAAFCEDFQSLEAWQGIGEEFGLTTVAVFSIDPSVVVLEEFASIHGFVLHSPLWGERVRNVKQHLPGLWIRCPALPIRPPYQAITTWGEMRTLFRDHGKDLDDTLKATFRLLRHQFPVFCAFGFPIPEFVKGALVQMHWQVCKLPALSFGEKFQPGYRKKHSEAYWLRDRATFLKDKDAMSWCRSENWSSIRSSPRGHLPAALRGSSAVIIGAGAVGSQLAELLVRGGVEKIAVVDDELYQMGNCVRHTLAMADIQLFKAPQLTQRLNSLTPFVRAESILSGYPYLKSDQRTRVDAGTLIVDCTGSDDLLAALQEQTFPSDRWFFSISLGREARRAYVFSVYGSAFPADRFFAASSSWTAEEAAQRITNPFSREGPGCWHPVFPASPEGVTLMTAAAVRHMAWVMENGEKTPRLTVFEQLTASNGSFSELKKVADEKLW